MIVKWADAAWDDYLWWRKRRKPMLERIDRLIQAIERDPFRGIGKPEPLRGPLAGFWSRRIDGEHRLVYKVERGTLLIAACRYHYGK